ncbi:hypothetical protein GN956_G27228, partial [Arapaima gigas]
PRTTYDPDKGPEKKLAAAESSGRRGSLYKRVSVVFLCLWIITLVALIAGLSFYCKFLYQNS